jgi:hypothetical protein
MTGGEADEVTRRQTETGFVEMPVQLDAEDVHLVDAHA